MLQVWWACFLSMPASAGSYEFCILSLSCFLFERCAWFEGGSRVSARQPSSFLCATKRNLHACVGRNSYCEAMWVETKKRVCDAVRRNSLRSCVAPFKQPPEI